MVDKDAVVARAARSIRVLSALSWPASVEARFLERYRGGQPELPVPPPVPAPPSDEALRDVLGRVDWADPLEAFVGRTAESAVQAIAMLRAAGTPRFTAHSTDLYGGPGTQPVPDGPTVLAEAEHLLRTADALGMPCPEKTLSTAQARDRFQADVDAFFVDLPVVVDPELVSLAAAGSRRIRIRGGVKWAPSQIAQLLQHEALVHSATKRNGLAQPLRTLGLSTPRTTAVQEGLATLGELITDSLDLNRLRRVALRVRMVDRALQGADFIEVFEGLLEEGQPEVEAFRSAMRVFRGGDVRGGVVFTKDVVYLSGLRQVHGFLMAALKAHRAELPAVLFAGRMTCGDAVKLAPLIEDGTLLPAQILPPWVQRTSQLAAYLAWAAFGQGIGPVELESLD